MSVAILCVFLAENVGLLYGEGLEFFHKPMEIMDFVVVCLSLYFELMKDTFAAGVLLLSRTWRFVRVIHGMIELKHEKQEEGGREGEERGKVAKRLPGR